MKTNIYLKSAAMIAGMSFLFAACTPDIYEPKDSATDPKDPGISQELKEFGFSTRGSVKLSVNYDAPGYKALIKVFKENPVDEAGHLKQNLESVYAAFTDDYGKFDGVMYIPSAINEAYLYTDRSGLPSCVKLNATEAGFEFDMTSPKATTARAATSNVKNLSDLGNSTGGNVYSLGKYDVNGRLATGAFTMETALGAKKELPGVIQKRVYDKIQADKANSSIASLLREPKILNVKTTANMEVNVTFLAEYAANYNTFGYYYYKNDGQPVTYSNFYGINKYAIFPNVSHDPNGGNVLTPGTTVQLLYFDENGTASTTFPEGYTIGWFLISDGFKSDAGGYSGKIRKIEEIAYQGEEWYGSRNTCFSNETVLNNFDPRQFVALTDESSGLYVIGVEDGGLDRRAKDDYADLLFCVSTTPASVDSELPVVPNPNPGENNEGGEFSMSGTLAFEDIWPKGGDYDMNDVALVYKRVFSFNENNMVTKVNEAFNFIHRRGAASINSYFAYQVDNMGTIDICPTDCRIESETGSIVVDINTLEVNERAIIIERSFPNQGIAKDVVAKDFDPYIMIGSQGDKRKEVHLPGYKGTSKVNHAILGTEDDAYYMKKDGQFPFAIDIPKTDFVLSREARSIDKTYPKFASWASSLGLVDKDWYLDTPKDN